jgi:hypothetical protein
MVFWLGILTGGLFAWYAIKQGFYDTWAIVFNIIVSVYLGIFLGPVIAEVVPGISEVQYSDLLAVACTAVGGFLILHLVTQTFFLSQFNVSFPRIFDTLGSAAMGFLAGFLVWSFVSVLICMLGISENSLTWKLGFGSSAQQANISCIEQCCGFVHHFAGWDDDETIVPDAISELLKNVKTSGSESLPDPNALIDSNWPGMRQDDNTPGP